MNRKKQGCRRSMDTMKRFLQKFAALALIVSFLAGGFCVNAQAASRGYRFKYKGVTAGMNDKADKLIEKLGDVTPTKKKSCAYDGESFTYKAKDLTLVTYTTEKGGTEYIQSVKFKTKNIKTAEGVKIGSKESTVKKKYGKRAKPEYGVYKFKKGKTMLYITVKDEKVTAIEYLALV